MLAACTAEVMIDVKQENTEYSGTNGQAIPFLRIALL
jgi:hypothetical protein